MQVEYQVTNQQATPLQVQFYGQLKQSTATPEGQQSGHMMASAYRGAAYSSDEQRYKKVTFKEMTEKNLAVTTPGGWVGMLQHYFVAAWAGQPEQKNEFYSLV